jgi:hypothetical protein
VRMKLKVKWRSLNARDARNAKETNRRWPEPVQERPMWAEAGKAMGRGFPSLLVLTSWDHTPHPRHGATEFNVSLLGSGLVSLWSNPSFWCPYSSPLKGKHLCSPIVS